MTATDPNTKSVKKREGESEDLRVRRTRKLLKDAFVELTVEKGFSTLTVQDIADRAMVNRSTFYRHYLDKYDLLDQFMDEVYNLSSEDEFVAEKLGQIPPDKLPGPLVLLKHIEQHVDFYRAMLGPKGDPAFAQRLRQNTERRFRYLYENQPVKIAPGDPPIDLRISYIAYAGVGAVVWWLENPQQCTVEQLANWLGQLASTLTGLTVKATTTKATVPKSVTPKATARKTTVNTH